MVLERNISCLYTTARVEVERKNESLRRQRVLCVSSAYSQFPLHPTHACTLLTAWKSPTPS